MTRVLFQHVSIISANREHQVGIPVYPIQSYLGIIYWFLLDTQYQVENSFSETPKRRGFFLSDPTLIRPGFVLTWETEVLNLHLGLLWFQTNPGGNEETRANTTIQKNCKECWLILVKVLRGLPGTAMLTKKFGLKKQMGKSTNFDCNPRVRNPPWNWGPKQLPPPGWPLVLARSAFPSCHAATVAMDQHPGTTPWYPSVNSLWMLVDLYPASAPKYVTVMYSIIGFDPVQLHAPSDFCGSVGTKSLAVCGSLRDAAQKRTAARSIALAAQPLDVLRSKNSQETVYLSNIILYIMYIQIWGL